MFVLFLGMALATVMVFVGGGRIASWLMIVILLLGVAILLRDASSHLRTVL